METLRGNRKATTHLPVYRYGYISRLSGMNPQFMVSDHLSGIPTIRPSADLGRQTGCWLTILPRSEGPRRTHVNAMAARYMSQSHCSVSAAPAVKKNLLIPVRER
jgi:hypothetical protein